MPELEDQSVSLVVTSPPYWQLKDYGEEKQIGFHQTYEEYINDLNLVWKECYRVLQDGCRMCINIGDQFARAKYYGRYKVIPIRTEIIKFCEIMGFDYMGAIIWQKATTMNTSGGASLMGSYPHPRNGMITLDYEFILLFKKPGDAPMPSKEIKESSAMTKEEWRKWFVGHWNFAGARQKEHLAAFPEELPYRLIKMFSFVHETVLDPFMGSGTTAAVAQKTKRKSIGYEINNQFIPIIQKRVSGDLAENSTAGVVVTKRKSTHYDRKGLLASLPYRFKDTKKIDKKVDPREITFGSKINMQKTGT
ncbi:MAG: site-specific DNA-methyltransferase [Candidatus Portiera sp.]|nr:site-specific DNA-methyltransferase [Portiera sp.]